MGNVNFCGKEGGANDEENNVVMSLADAASAGARQAVVDAFHRARHGGPGADQSAAPASVIDGLLPVAVAQQEAANGARHGIDERAPSLKLARRFNSAIEDIKFAAGSGAKKGLEAAQVMIGHDIEGNPKVVTLELAAAAAGTGAWIACLVSAQAKLTPTPNATKYTSLLGPMLGGSMPTSAAIYNLVHGSSDFVKLCGFGGITLGVFVISYGLVAGLLGRTSKSVQFTKIATIAAVTLLLVCFTVALCTMFQQQAYRIACGTVGGVLIGVLLIFCLILHL